MKFFWAVINVLVFVVTDYTFRRNSISQETFALKTSFAISWRRLEDFFHLSLQKTSSRRLQDIFIKTNIFTLPIYLQKTSSRLFEDVFKSPQSVFKTSSRRLQDIFETSSRHFEDVFKTFARRMIKLNCCC